MRGGARAHAIACMGMTVGFLLPFGCGRIGFEPAGTDGGRDAMDGTPGSLDGSVSFDGFTPERISFDALGFDRFSTNPATSFCEGIATLAGDPILDPDGEECVDGVCHGSCTTSACALTCRGEACDLDCREGGSCALGCEQGFCCLRCSDGSDFYCAGPCSLECP